MEIGVCGEFNAQIKIVSFYQPLREYRAPWNLSRLRDEKQEFLCTTGILVRTPVANGLNNQLTSSKFLLIFYLHVTDSGF